MEARIAALEEAQAHVSRMEEAEDGYFGADKEKRQRRAAAAVAACVHRVLDAPSTELSKETRVRAFFLHGRAVSLAQGQDRISQDREAEALLSKAIKLDPSHLGAWNALGEFYWNLQEFGLARQMFEQAIRYCGKNPVCLRNLSMVIRALGGDRAARERNFAEALELSKEAVALDPTDPESWETLGNAYAGVCFLSARCSTDELQKALAAYAQAEAAYAKRKTGSPTLHLNRGRAAKYVEEYDLALSSFTKAHDMGASKIDEGRGVVSHVQHLAGLVERRGDIKSKRLDGLISDLPRGAEGRTLRELRSGAGRGAAPLVAKVVKIIDRQDEVPFIVLCCDSAKDFFALSLYNVERSKVIEAMTPMKSVLQIQHPLFRQISVTGPNGKQYGYPSVRVVNPQEVAIV